MGLFDSFKRWFKQADDIEKMAKDGIEQAKGITKMIPGDADDKIVDTVSKKIDDVTEQIDNVKNSLPGNGK
jgi:hypothetical protein